MRISLFLRAAFAVLIVPCLGVAVGNAQSPTPDARELYPDSPARANPRNPGPRRFSATPEAAPRINPRGPLDWEHVECLSPDGRWYVTINLDGRRRVWDLASGRSEVELPAGVNSVVLSPDSRLLACRMATLADPGAINGGWQILTVDGKPAGAPLEFRAQLGKALEHVCFSPDSKRLTGFITTGELNVISFNVDDGRVAALQVVKELQSGAVLAYSPDGRTLAAVGSGAAGVLLNAIDLKPMRVLPGTDATFGTVAFSPDGRLLAIGGEEQRTVRGQTGMYPAAGLYEVTAGRLIAVLKVLPISGTRVRQVLFADGGRALVTATDAGVQTWAASDGRLQANLPEASYPVALSPDGRTLAGSQFPDLACWGTEAWHLGVRIGNARVGAGRGGGPVPLIFTPDGNGIITIRSASIAAWELSTGRPVAERAATQLREEN